MKDSTLPHQSQYGEWMTREIIAEFLDWHNTMSLATSRGGAVYAAPLFYASEGLTLYFISDPGSAHSVNISLNPEVAITICKDYSDWKKVRGLQMKGRAYEVPEGETEPARKIFEKKYPFLAELLGMPELFRGARGIAYYKVVPETVRLIDNSVRFGYKAELSFS